MTMYIDIKMSQ